MAKLDCIHFGDKYFGSACTKQGCHGDYCSEYKSKNQPAKIETPTLDKMLSVKDESERLGDFLEWLQAKYYMRDKKQAMACENTIVHFTDSSYINIEKLLAEYFDIDLTEAEKEKQAILKGLAG